MSERRFPIQGGLTVSWAAAEEAYRGYSRLYGTDQSIYGARVMARYARLMRRAWKRGWRPQVELTTTAALEPARAQVR